MIKYLKALGWVKACSLFKITFLTPCSTADSIACTQVPWKYIRSSVRSRASSSRPPSSLTTPPSARCAPTSQQPSQHCRAHQPRQRLVTHRTTSAIKVIQLRQLELLLQAQQSRLGWDWMWQDVVHLLMQRCGLQVMIDDRQDKRIKTLTAVPLEKMVEV